MISYPMVFPVSAESKSGIESLWSSSAGPHSIEMAIPPEFQGKGGGFSPEDLYAMALSNCFIATFKVLAERSRLAFASVSVESKLIVDRGEGGKPWMARLEMDVKLTGAEGEKALQLLKRTSESCMILNSVKTEKAFNFSVVP